MAGDGEVDKGRGKSRKISAALRYFPEEHEAPKIVAIGRGLIAERIVALAREHGVPVHEDAELAGALVDLEVGSEIPPDLYRAVAEILALFWKLEERTKTMR